MFLKKGTQVKIISGKDKGKTGEILEIDRKLILGCDATSSGPRLHLPFRTMIIDSFTPLRCRLQWGIWSARCVYIEKYEQNWNRACGLGLPPHAFFHYF